MGQGKNRGQGLPWRGWLAYAREWRQEKEGEHMMRGIGVAVLGLTLLGAAAQEIDAKLARAVADNPYRTAAEIQRDRYRHPSETLSFFGIAPHMTVAEISPGGGWYANILGPYLKDEGRYIAVEFSPDFADSARRARALDWQKGFIADKEKFGPRAAAAFMGGAKPFAPPDSVDMVLTFRAWHNWIPAGQANLLLREFYQVLKPGGVLGIVQHREDENSPRTPQMRSGYVKESTLIEMAAAAGFVLAARSAINANPKDSKNWPRGVWTLPPTLAMGEEGRETYLAVGESDRMTLKFIKPAP